MNLIGSMQSRAFRALSSSASVSVARRALTTTPVLRFARPPLESPMKAPAGANGNNTAEPSTVKSMPSLASQTVSPLVASESSTFHMEADAFAGIATQAFPDAVVEILLAEVDPADIEIKPDGLLYLPEIKYRRILNRAFKPGGWALAPRGPHSMAGRVISREYALYAYGRFISQARGEQEVFDEKQLATAMEGCKSNALMRCCKDIGIASELWDPSFIRAHKAKYCEHIWVRHVVRNTKLKLWRRKGQSVEYPTRPYMSRPTSSTRRAVVAVLALLAALAVASAGASPVAVAGAIATHERTGLFRRAALALPPPAVHSEGGGPSTDDSDEAQPQLMPVLDADVDSDADGAADDDVGKDRAKAKDASVEYEIPVAVPVTPVPVSSAGPAGKAPNRRPQSVPNTPYRERPSDELPVAIPVTTSGPRTTTPTQIDVEVEEQRRSLITSSVMIIVSEIGDKTFLIAAIMAMTHPRALVFAAAWSALAVMSVLSALLGNVLPALLSRTYTQALAGALFLVFGVRMVREARAMPADASTDEELAEVQAEIKARDKHEYERVERGTAGQPADGAPLGLIATMGRALARVAEYILSPIFVETFILTFLAEWGDRSQIATIAMAAAGNVGSVILGTVVGHSLCTGIAVLGGKMLATRISVRTVTYVGGLVFLVFAVLTFAYLDDGSAAA
ncbi:GCR1-dependent translation factor 1 [Blastocladiella emersonii ATCC 22665]|nr:GCR1-dependent translation factor 1 [Blastocladiella emersonii ATCC 22665]